MRIFARIVLLLSMFSSLFASTNTVKKEYQKSPIGADISLSNAVGTGTFLRQFERAPYLYTGLTLYPKFTLPAFANGSSLKIYFEQYFSTEWLESFGASEISSVRRLSAGDLKIRAKWSNALKFADVGISFSPAIKAEFPISNSSANANRMVALGANFSLMWSMKGFFILYKPSLTGYVHHAPYKTVACGDSDDISNERAIKMSRALDPRNPDYAVDQHMEQLTPTKKEYRIGNGRCMVSGRQTMALLKNAVFAGYSQGNHSFTMGFRFYHAYLRPLAPRPELRAMNSSLQSFKESTLGVLEYGYSFPIEFPLSMTLGIASYQPSFDNQGNFRFPFFDFATPANNFTEIYFGLDLSV